MNEVIDKHEARVFAEEALVVDVQIFLHNLMEEKGMSRAKLADAMGVSRARVSQMLSDESQNLTVRLLARAAHALGETVEFDCEHFRQKREAKVNNAAASGGNVHALWCESADAEDFDVANCHADGRLKAFISLHDRKVAA